MRSYSKSKIDKLGGRLARDNPPTDDDMTMLEVVRADHDQPMARVQHVLVEELGIESTSRLKTTGTIIDKVRRERTRLSTLQDIAGLRVVIDMGLQEQDEIVSAIVERFPDSKVKDRRAEPSHGYRAVHVMVEMEDCVVEVQVRTTMQDLWAQATEKLADRVGREIRYGEPPAVDSPAVREVLKMLATGSELVAAMEMGAKELEETRSRISVLQAALAHEQLKEAPKQLDTRLAEAAAKADELQESRNRIAEQQKALLARMITLLEQVPSEIWSEE